MNSGITQLLDTLIITEFSQPILLIVILSVMEKNKKASIFSRVQACKPGRFKFLSDVLSVKLRLQVEVKNEF